MANQFTPKEAFIQQVENAKRFCSTLDEATIVGLVRVDEGKYEIFGVTSKPPEHAKYYYNALWTSALDNYMTSGPNTEAKEKEMGSNGEVAQGAEDLIEGSGFTRAGEIIHDQRGGSNITR